MESSNGVSLDPVRNSDHDRCEHGLATPGLDLVKDLGLGTPSSMEVRKYQGNMEKLPK